MSPSGKVQPQIEAGGKEPLASKHLGSGATPSLPLRLSVARGGLGLELCESISVGPLVVDELEVELPGLNYPLDLSKGVKQFRNRRSILRHISLRIDTDELGRHWAASLSELFGQGVKVRLRPVYGAEAESHDSRKNDAHQNDAQQNDASCGIPSLAVTIHRGKVALAFDLVVISGASPRLAIDSPRVVGRSEPPLYLALQALDWGLAAAARVPTGSGGGLSLGRSGRSVEMEGLAEAISLFVLPQLGCRLPQVLDQVIVDVSYDAGNVRVALGHREEPLAAGRRALRVASAADFLTRADTALGMNDQGAARAAYIEALERAPGHAEALLALAELDLAAGARGEAALSFLQELDAVERGALPAPLARSRQILALARALGATGRRELADETLKRVMALESDPVLLGLLALELSEREDDPQKKREHLDVGVARAPYLEETRWARLGLALLRADFRTAEIDAEHLEAAVAELPERAAVCRRVGECYLHAARHLDAIKWLKRALRLDPDEPKTMLSLARCLAENGERLRAAELLQNSITRLERPLSSDPVGKEDAPERGEGTSAAEASEITRESLSEARFLLARLLLEEEFEPATALAHLTAVETRSSVGVRARLMEAEVHHERGQIALRDRALSRLFEAAEMKWVRLLPHRTTWERLLTSWGDSLDESLASFAQRILRAEGDGTEKTS